MTSGPQEKDYDQADRYADLAMTADRYNPAALINKGNTVFVRHDYAKAAEFYKEALRNDSSCTEALYNLGKLTADWSSTTWVNSGKTSLAGTVVRGTNLSRDEDELLWTEGPPLLQV